MAKSYQLKPKIKQKLKKEIKEFPELEPIIPDEEIFADELIYDPSLIEEDDLPLD
jgi:predicted house-cleaning noncanonical NTP pyrophosphatase (MazG superfamily)